MYKEKRPHRSEFVPIRGLDYHVRIWEGVDAKARQLPPLVLAHGWMDVGASYQFMVDALSDDFADGRTIIAHDWRGFGLTKGAKEGPQPDNYWYADYFADLDFLLDHYSPGQPVDLLGHSMGGNAVMSYAGIRPTRIRKLINLEGFGQPPAKPSEAPTRYAKWIDEIKAQQRGEISLKTYEGLEGVAKRLMKTNPRLSADKASWLASHWSQPASDGQWAILGDPAHKIVSANLYRVEETLALYARITAPLLAVEASDDSLGKWFKGVYSLDDYHERLKHVPQATVAVVQDAGHMLHHDQPEQLARLIEDFLRSNL